MDEDKIKNPERISAQEEMRQVFEQSHERKPEKFDISREEAEKIRQNLLREVSEMEDIPELKKEAQEKANQIGSLGLEQIFERLLEVARQKDLVRAIQVAKNMNDPNILDSFHDYLAENGRYKEFIKDKKWR